ncbi:cysteine desulfurase family protein [Mesorhizobium sp. NFR06]|uniref:cysteine desulfurase family protein n=1 Tax=Mesorhizobium sp. NFR06 TaxID=1566290 RepID=UPI00122D6A14|nr:cysteine desulfurase family protein [Mesorhizobium sp. NFR06]
MTISLDHHATTPAAQQVVDAMAPYWRDVPFNAHSAHAGGALSESAVETARATIADLVGASAQEITFTSGATEANNLAILGLARAAQNARPERTRILTSAIEHKCVLEAARHLATQGFEHEMIPVLTSGHVDVEQLEAMLDDRVLLVAVMAANNEIGTIQPLPAIARLCEAAGAMLHVDAAQVVGRMPFDVFEIGCDTASFSAHKMYGPKGVGALYVSAAAKLRPKPILFGGGQESGLRPGTLPVPLIVGFGRAAELAAQAHADGPRLRELAVRFLLELDRLGIDAHVNGSLADRLPGSLNIHIPGVDAEELIQRLGDSLHLSTGSACQSGELQGSHVLRAIGLPPKLVSASFRLCFGIEHDVGDAVKAAHCLADSVHTCESAAGRNVQWQEIIDGGVLIGRV